MHTVIAKDGSRVSEGQALLNLHQILNFPFRPQDTRVVMERQRVEEGLALVRGLLHIAADKTGAYDKAVLKEDPPWHRV